MSDHAHSVNGRPVYIVDGSRTPMLKAEGKPGPFNAADLAVATARSLLLRQSFSAEQLDEVVLGCVMPGPSEANIARIVALRLGCGNRTTAFTVQRNCASGMQALDSAFRNIANGTSDLVLAGGTEAMSHAPVLFNHWMVEWLSRWSRSRGFWQKAGVLMKIRPMFFAPVIGLLKGLTDPIVGLSMGQTAENLAYRFHISREEMDSFALQSHQRLAAAQDEHRLTEVTPIYDAKGVCYGEDTGLRRDSSLEKLARLKPVFDRKYGNVTAGNSAQVTDGACCLVLASEEAVEKYGLKVRGRIVDCTWAGVDPAEMGLGPAHAIPPLLQRNQLKLQDIDFWEINEAFSAQVLACLAVLQDEEYCKNRLNLPAALGEININTLNVDGGGISIGHPVGTSGARIVLHLQQVLEQREGKYGVASLCIGGGQGGAMLIERIGEAQV